MSEAPFTITNYEASLSFGAKLCMESGMDIIIHRASSQLFENFFLSLATVKYAVLCIFLLFSPPPNWSPVLPHKNL